MINPNDMSITNMQIGQSKINSLTSLVNSKILDKSQDEKLKKAAGDFEAIFIKQFMDIMDSTVQKSEFMHGGRAEETFKSLLNEQIANNISSSPRTSFGLANQIYRQLKDNFKG